MQKIVLFIKKRKPYVIAALAIAVLVFITLFVIKLSKPSSLQQLTKAYGTAGSETVKSFAAMPVVAPVQTKDGLEIADDMQYGIQIKFANQQEKPNDQPKEQTKVAFPNSLDQPLTVNLPGGKNITIKDKNADKMRSVSVVTANDRSDSASIVQPQGMMDKIKKLTGFGQVNGSQQINPDIVRYESNDGRKVILYGYQKDQATGERKLKNWILYSKGTGAEEESYEISNAKIKIDEDGNAQLYLDDGKDTQNQQALAGVDQGLIERAQKAIAADMGGDIMNPNKAPDLTIPHPYYVDKDGNLIDLKWNLDEKTKTISVKVEATVEQYPLALDPTLQFTAPGQSNTGTVINGESGSYFGNAMVAGDFNADGKIDLAVAGDGYSSNIGRVYVFFNDGSMASSAAGADVIITGGANNYFGVKLAAGDFNGDGKVDLAATVNNGTVYVFYQGTTLVTGTIGNSPLVSPGVTIINGEDASFGSSIIAGDFDSDGKTDLAVGAKAFNPGGRVYIFYQKATLISGTVGLASLMSPGITIITGEGGYFGDSLAAGDFDSDGKTDLGVGADLYYAGSANTGRVYVFYQKTTIITGTVGVTLTSPGITIITGAGGNNQLGYSLASGDINSDGKTDLAVGAHAYNNGQGKVYVFYQGPGLATGTVGQGNLISPFVSTITGENTSDFFGYALKAGDFNADGKIDLAVSTYITNSRAGRAYIFYNDGTIPTTASAADVLIIGEVQNDYFGTAMEAGDFNADGKADLVMGANNYSGHNGRTYIFYSQNGQVNTNQLISGEVATNYNFGYSLATGDFNADGRVDLAVSAVNVLNGSMSKVYIFFNDGMISTNAAQADVILSDTSGGFFGSAFVVGDFNSDGKTDLAVAASSTNSNKVYVFYSKTNWTSGTASTLADVAITGEASSGFGNSLAAGDLDSDGKVDLVVSATAYGSGVGRVYVFYQKSTLVSGSIGSGSLVLTNLTYLTGDSSNNLGSSIAVGDFDSDGKNDLATSTPAGYGKAYVFYQSALVTGSSIAPSAAQITISGSDTGGYISYGLVAGDFNNDGKTDLALGGPNTVFVLFQNSTLVGGTLGLGALDLASIVRINGEGSLCWGNNKQMVAADFNSDGKLDLAVSDTQVSTSAGRTYIFYQGSQLKYGGSADVTITGDAASSYFGYSLAAGDLNSDGKQDLIIGANNYSSGIGRVYLYETRDAYAWQLQKSYLIGTRTSGSAGQESTITGQAASNFGSSFITGDFNGDGKADLAVGASGYNSSQGRVYVFYNDGTLSSTASSADLVIVGESVNSNFAWSMTAGDFNSDGKTDLAVGASIYGSNTGRAYIFYQGSKLTTGNASGANVIITGESTNNYFGTTMTAGDFNADGRMDLAVGAHAYSSSAGRAYILYNDGSIPTTAASADVIITGEASSYFGVAMTAGDFNGDGRIDLAVGANIYSSNTGRAYIFYNDGIIPTTAASADVIITGEASSYFGVAMKSGDFNADGKTDLAVGAYNYNASTGRAYIFYNDGSIPTTAITADIILNGESSGNYFGKSIMVGDFNGDGKIDLVVGAYAYSSSTGRAYIFNQGSKLTNGTNASSADTIITGENASDQFGYALASGDLNNDGKTDLIVSANQYKTNYGKVYLYSGAPTNIAGGNLVDQFGYSMAAGDFNGDGKVDLAVGAPGYVNTGAANAGRVYVFYNRGSSVSPTVATADAIITGTAAGDQLGTSLAAWDYGKAGSAGTPDGSVDLAVGAAGNSKLYVFYNGFSGGIAAAAAGAIITSAGGSSMATGDFNADGRIDVAISNSANAGTVYVLAGGTAYASTSSPAAAEIISGESGSGLGSSLTSGDFNSDSKTDLALGAIGYSSNAGRVYIIYNSGSWTATIALPTFPVAGGLIINGEVGSKLGSALAVGDFNSDGKMDLAVGAIAYGSGGATNLGRAYVFNQNSAAGFASSLAATAANTIITGQAVGDNFGSSLVASDFNQDGKTDLAVGATGFNPGSAANTGKAYIFYNNNGVLQNDIANPGSYIVGNAAQGYFGNTMLAADFSRDGIMDLAVGAFGNGSAVGSVYVFPFQSGPNFQAPVSSRGTFKTRGVVKMQ